MTSQCRRLDGRFALITGASRGIGRAIAERFAAEGATVAINYAGSQGAAEETLKSVQAISAEEGFADRKHRIVQADVGKPEAIAAMFKDVLAAFGRLDILVNNAGIQTETPSETYPLADYERVIAVNLTGALLCSQAALRHFLNRPTGSLGYGAATKHSGGVILNCSSVHEIIPKPGYIAYSISKGGMENLTRTLALEYADKGIRVNAVGPGAVDTDMNARWINDPKMRHDVESHIPMGRAAGAQEMAAVFAFLASDDASYITGQTIFACGGLTLFGDFKKNWSS
ncbi:glucose 1-dehydrogenase [Dongia sedimenti]|uniref:SDR family oxidoreductase n=1 Tax=Dongia sedimenti TaxID=3064282 RepID=A0ABU0YLL3_9PROT|nr:SDR family oxidoreductase [Rhodospirillaceae bacterium R-7]